MSGAVCWHSDRSGWSCDASVLGWPPGQIPVQVLTPAGLVSREQWLPFSAHDCDAAERQVLGWRCRIDQVVITVFND